MNEAQVQETLIRLSDLKLELTSRLEAAQSMLFKYVTSEKYPIDERFEVWAEWCEKRDYNWENFIRLPVLGIIITDEELFWLEGVKADCFYVVKIFSASDVLRTRYDITVDGVKELLIQCNFGSFEA